MTPGTWTGAYGFDTAARCDVGPTARALRRQYAAMEGYVPDMSYGGYNCLPARRRYGHNHVTGDRMTVTTLRSYVDQAIRGGGRLEILFHSAGIGAGGNISAADFGAFLDFLAGRANKGLVNVLNPTAAVYATRGEGYNLIPGGRFDAAAAWEEQGSESPVMGDAGSQWGRLVEIRSQLGTLRLDLPAAAMRGARFRCRAENPGANAVNARVILRCSRGSTNYLDLVLSPTIAPGGGWALIDATVGSDPRADGFRVWLYSANTGPVRYADVSLVRL